MEEKMLTVEQVASRLNVSIEAVRRYITQGILRGGIRIKLKAIKLGKEYRIEPSDLEDFRAQLRRAA